MNSQNYLRPDNLPVNIRLLVALGLVILFHGALLPFTASATYDANIHMFFGDHYARSWFDPWEPRWYTGFTTTSYPPGTHMGIGALSFIFPLTASFNIMMVLGLCTFVVGVYRFSLLFVESRAAGYAALAVVFSSSLVETVHVFGQLPTVFSLALFLNGLPHVYRWLVSGSVKQLAISLIFACATTSAHHVTTIFGTVLFIGPVGIYAWLAYLDQDPRWRDANLSRLRRLDSLSTPLLRGVLLAVLLVGSIVLTVFPYWYWSITDPITQVSIPHGTRENFLERIDLGIVFFVIPWGLAIFVLPYVALKSFKTRMWPLGLSILVCFILGTGGTTSIPKYLLGPAFEILTLDRFTFWATIMTLPFIGMLVESQLHGRLKAVFIETFGTGKFVVGSAISLGLFLLIAVEVGILSSIRPTQPDKIDPAPIVKFMEEDNHDDWRYLTLGFGDQFAYISSLMSARSVDGNYHSARRLPEMTSYAVERLENSKYLGVPGLGSLQQFLVNSDKYRLKYIFSNDSFYDPLLFFSGWNRLNRLSNGIVVWEKPDTKPLPAVERRRSFPLVHRLMWGTLPPLALVAGYIVLLSKAFFKGNDPVPKNYRRIAIGVQRVGDVGRTQKIVAWIMGLVIAGVVWFAASVATHSVRGDPPETVLEKYYHHLDFRRFTKAFDMLAHGKDLTLERYLLWLRWEGGLIASYAKLKDIETEEILRTEDSIDWKVVRTYLTPFGVTKKTEFQRTVLEEGLWKITARRVQGYAPPHRIQSEPSVSWSRAGKRRPLLAMEHQDVMDRPRLSVLDARLIKEEDRYKLVGLLRNNDVDPAGVKYTGRLMDVDGYLLNQHQAGVGSAHRLLPGEIGFFVIRFEGVLSLQDELKSGAFDPTLFIPPKFTSKPTKSELLVTSNANELGIYRGLAMTGIESVEATEGRVVHMQITNTGTEQAEVVQVQYALFDQSGRIVRTGHKMLDKDLKPGQTQAFETVLPNPKEVKLISELGELSVRTNGKIENSFNARVAPSHLPGFLALPESSGYSGVLLTVKSMTFEPLF